MNCRLGLVWIQIAPELKISCSSIYLANYEFTIDALNQETISFNIDYYHSKIEMDHYGQPSYFLLTVRHKVSHSYLRVALLQIYRSGSMCTIRLRR